MMKKSIVFLIMVVILIASICKGSYIVYATTFEPFNVDEYEEVLLINREEEGDISLEEAREIARKVYPDYYYIYSSSFKRNNGEKYYVFDIKRKVDGHYTRDTSIFVSFDGETCIEGDYIVNDNVIKVKAYNNNNLLLEINNVADEYSLINYYDCPKTIGSYTYTAEKADNLWYNFTCKRNDDVVFEIQSYGSQIISNGEIVYFVHDDPTWIGIGKYNSSNKQSNNYIVSYTNNNSEYFDDCISLVGVYKNQIIYTKGIDPGELCKFDENTEKASVLLDNITEAEQHDCYVLGNPYWGSVGPITLKSYDLAVSKSSTISSKVMQYKVLSNKLYYVEYVRNYDSNYDYYSYTDYICNVYVCNLDGSNVKKVVNEQRVLGGVDEITEKYISVMSYDYDTDTTTKYQIKYNETNSENDTIVYYDGDSKKNLKFNYDFDDCLKDDATEYNTDLSYLLSAFATSAYQKEGSQFTLLKDTTNGSFPQNPLAITESLRNFGFKAEKDDVREFNYYSDASDSSYGDDVTAYTLATKNLSDGTKLVLVVIRGSYGDIKKFTSDWKSNVNFNNYGVGLHEGFNSAANNIIQEINVFKNDKSINDKNVKYVITGHSRGAAVANLVAKKIIDSGVSNSKVYDYNFACPDSGRDYSNKWNPDGKYDSLFNINNVRDIVGVIPGNIFNSSLNINNFFSSDSLGIVFWGKYGHTYFFSANWDSATETMIGGFDQHDSKLYMYQMEKKQPTISYKSWEQSRATLAANVAESSVYRTGKVLGVFCPVDIEVINKDGVKVAEVINGEINYYKESFGDVVIISAGDQNLIYVNGSNDYYVKLIGNDTGSMSYCVSDAVLGDEYGTDIEYYDVLINKGKTMVSIVNSDLKSKDTTLVLLNEESNPVSQIDTNGEEKVLPDEIKEEYSKLSLVITQYTIEYNLNGGVVSGNPTTYKYSSDSFLLKNPQKQGYIFTGWTGSNGDVPQTTVTIKKGTTGNLNYTANWKRDSGLTTSETKSTEQKTTERTTEKIVEPIKDIENPIKNGTSEKNEVVQITESNNTKPKDQSQIIKEDTVIPQITSDQNINNIPKNNMKIIVNDLIYRITSSDENGGTLEFVKPSKKDIDKVKIPSRIIINDKEYKVTSIKAKAFKNNKKLKQVDIGKNIKKIGKQAFYKCKKLNKLVIRSKKLTNKKVGSNAFKGVNKNVKVFAPEKKISAYKKFLKKKGLKKNW